MEVRSVMAWLSAVLLLTCCERIDDDPQKYLDGEDTTSMLPLYDVASVLCGSGLGRAQVMEVYEAVSSSSANGYDEEYMMRDLFREPGAGVGDDRLSEEALALKKAAVKARMEAAGRTDWGRAPGAAVKAGAEEAVPLKTLMENYIRAREAGTAVRSGGGAALSAGAGLAGSGGGAAAKAGAGGVPVRSGGGLPEAERYLTMLQESDIQIYWPYSENWDGDELPVITYDPEDGSETNVGYLMEEAEDGTIGFREVIVDEAMAMERPVWVVNRNDDSEYTSLEMLRMQDPDWGNNGGEIVVRPRSESFSYGDMKSGDDETKTLVLKYFTMLRNYDPWFAGASEFFVKMGSVENFTAATEAEMLVYSPSVTDFMVVVKRKYLGQRVPFNAILVSDWTEQLSSCALMISEDDGGTKTSWKCSAVVKIKSRSYGFEIELPVNSRDDIVWRGSVSRSNIEDYVGEPMPFGGVELTFDFL